MTEYATTYPTQNLGAAGCLFWLLVAAVLSLATITLGAHAIERHGAAAQAVRSCLDGQPPLETWTNPLTGRDAHICHVDDRFGLQIVEGGQEVTSFVKDKLRTLAQVRQYLMNRGYLLPK